MLVIIDCGHGRETKGKRSPDESFYEWLFNREIGYEVGNRLISLGYNVSYTVHSDEDLSLANRVSIINDLAKQVDKCFVISIHANAFGNDWNNAHGWSIYTSPGVTESDNIADYFYHKAKDFFGTDNVRIYNGDKEPDYEENFYILTKTTCPAVITENFFYTNKKDLEFLQTSEGKSKIVEFHVEAIKAYIRGYL